MIKEYIHKLKNGCTIIMAQDNSKHSTYGEIYVKYGGGVKNVIIEGKKYEIPDGIAHILEHTVIENSKKGNLLKYMSERNASINAYTSQTNTFYFVDCVNYFKKNFSILLESVLDLKFTENQLRTTLKPIIEERKRVQDRKYRKFNEAVMKNVLTENGYIDNLGTLKTLTTIESDFIRLIYDTFYQPENIVIGISGKFDKDEMIELIENTFNKIKKKKINYEVIDELESTKIKEPYTLVYDNQWDEMIRVTYKCDISHIKSKERVDLSYYIMYYLVLHFSDRSVNFKKIVDNKYSSFSFDYGAYVRNDILIINVICFTTYLDEVTTIIKDVFKKVQMNEEFFNLWKNKEIIHSLTDNMYSKSVLKSHIDNLVNYDYDSSDTVDNIKNLDYKTCKSLLSSIDFSHIAIVQELKENN